MSQENVEGIGDWVRIGKRCREATAHIARPRYKRDARPYVEQCAPIVIEIAIEEIEAELPEK